jgi:hypothetical protein
MFNRPADRASKKRHARNRATMLERRKALGLGDPPRRPPGFGNLGRALQADRDSIEGRERSRRLDALLREKLGLPAVEHTRERPQPPEAPAVRVGKANPRPAQSNFKKSSRPRAGYHYIEKGKA